MTRKAKGPKYKTLRKLLDARAKGEIPQGAYLAYVTFDGSIVLRPPADDDAPADAPLLFEAEEVTDLCAQLAKVLGVDFNVS